jgi:hypothetical protein
VIWQKLIVFDASRTNQVFPQSSTDPDTRKEVLKFGIWNQQMVRLLRQLTRRLSDTVGAWEAFRRNDIDYFEYDGEPPASSFIPSRNAVKKSFLELNAILHKLQSLRKELCEDNPQGVSRLFPSFG